MATSELDPLSRPAGLNLSALDLDTLLSTTAPLEDVFPEHCKFLETCERKSILPDFVGEGGTLYELKTSRFPLRKGSPTGRVERPSRWPEAYFTGAQKIASVDRPAISDADYSEIEKRIMAWLDQQSERLTTALYCSTTTAQMDETREAATLTMEALNKMLEEIMPKKKAVEKTEWLSHRLFMWPHVRVIKIDPKDYV